MENKTSIKKQIEIIEKINRAIRTAMNKGDYCMNDVIVVKNIRYNSYSIFKKQRL